MQINSKYFFATLQISYFVVLRIDNMPVFFQHRINADTRLGIWKIEETEEFFKGNVPQHRDVTHPHKRLQHLAGRFLLQFLAPDFPYELVEIADTRKPFLRDERYHFSISHCGDYAAAIVSRTARVGIDIEVPVSRLAGIRQKFLSPEEQQRFGLPPAGDDDLGKLTGLWSAKEAVYKWYGKGGLDFRTDMPLYPGEDMTQVSCRFTPTGEALAVQVHSINPLMLAWVMS